MESKKNLTAEEADRMMEDSTQVRHEEISDELIEKEVDKIEKAFESDDGQQAMDVRDKLDRRDDEIKAKDYQDIDALETFQVKLTDEEKAVKADDLVILYDKIRQAEAVVKAAKEAFKNKKSDIEAEIEAILNTISEGVERQIPCNKRLHYGDDVVYFYCKKAGNLIEERPMRPEDRQLRLQVDIKKNTFVSDEDSMTAGQGSTSAVEEVYEEKEEKLEAGPEVAQEMRSNTPIDL